MLVRGGPVRVFVMTVVQSAISLGEDHQRGATDDAGSEISIELEEQTSRKPREPRRKCTRRKHDPGHRVERVDHRVADVRKRGQGKAPRVPMKVPDLTSHRNEPIPGNRLCRKIQRYMEDKMAAVRMEPPQEPKWIFDMLEHVDRHDQIEDFIIVDAFCDSKAQPGIGVSPPSGGQFGTYVRTNEAICIRQGTPDLAQDSATTTADVIYGCRAQMISRENSNNLARPVGRDPVAVVGIQTRVRTVPVKLLGRQSSSVSWTCIAWGILGDRLRCARVVAASRSAQNAAGAVPRSQVSLPPSVEKVMEGKLAYEFVSAAENGFDRITMPINFDQDKPWGVPAKINALQRLCLITLDIEAKEVDRVYIAVIEDRTKRRRRNDNVLCNGAKLRRILRE